jgi:hypothetical protein
LIFNADTEVTPTKPRVMASDLRYSEPAKRLGAHSFTLPKFMPPHTDHPHKPLFGVQSKRRKRLTLLCH